MGTANDAAALLAYQNAMPGYTVTGYAYSNFESTDIFIAELILFLIIR